MGVALLGSVKVALAKRLDIDEARIGGLVSMFGFAMIPVMLVMGFLTDLLDKQAVVLAGAFLIVLSLVVLSRAGQYALALLAVLLLSAGWSALVNVLNVLMVPAFGGSPTYAMNLGNFFFGLGAFATPLAVVYLLKRIGFSPAVLVLCVVPLLAGLGALMVDFDALRAEGEKEAAAGAEGSPAAEEPGSESAAEEAAISEEADPGIGALLVDPVMWLCALALLFYAPMEATMAAWATTYLGDQGTSEGRASLLLSGFWLAFMASRLATALIVSAVGLPAGGDTILIIVLSVLCVAVWGGSVLSTNRMTAGTMVVLAGLVFGPTFPTIIGVLMGHVDPSLGGRAVGLFFAVGGIGWSLIPMAIGAYARKTSVQKAFVIAVGAAVGLTVISIALHFVRTL
jgi:MFS family permease